MAPPKPERTAQDKFKLKQDEEVAKVKQKPAEERSIQDYLLLIVDKLENINPPIIHVSESNIDYKV